MIACAGNQLTFGQGVNNITIQPSNPTATDTVFVISDFSYYGNCAVGLVNEDIIQSGTVINIYPEYCGFGGSTLCNSVDTFSLGVLPIGNYIVNIEVKSESSEDKIKKQLIRNQYYLSHINKVIHNVCFARIYL